MKLTQMKFRILISFLTIAFIGLAIAVIYYANELEASIAAEKASNIEIKAAKIKLKESNDSITVINKKLEAVMEELNISTTKEQELRRKQLRNQKYNLGIEVQAKNENYYDLIAYAIRSGFELNYSNQKRGGFNGDPIIYYYSENGKLIAEELKLDLQGEFPNLAEINVIKGNSVKPPSTLTAKLRFKY